MKQYLTVLSSIEDGSTYIAFTDANSEYEAGMRFLEEFVGWESVAEDLEFYCVGNNRIATINDLMRHAADCDYNLIVTLAKDIEEL